MGNGKVRQKKTTVQIGPKAQSVASMMACGVHKPVADPRQHAACNGQAPRRTGRRPAIRIEWVLWDHGATIPSKCATSLTKIRT